MNAMIKLDIEDCCTGEVELDVDYSVGRYGEEIEIKSLTLVSINGKDIDKMGLTEEEVTLLEKEIEEKYSEAIEEKCFEISSDPWRDDDYLDFRDS